MKRRILIIMVSFLLSSIYGCSKSGSEKIFGKYSFDKLIYYSPLNPIHPEIEKISEAKYVMKKDRFEVISPDLKFEVKNPIYIEEEITDDLVQKFNDATIDRVSISKYKEKYRYKIYKREDTPSDYCLFLLDDELWIARYTPGIKKYGIWCIYKLK